MTNQRRSRTRPALLCALALVLPLSGGAAVPGQVNYQGLLLDNAGSPVTGSVDMVFSLFGAR